MANPVEAFDTYPVIITDIKFFKSKAIGRTVKTAANTLKFSNMAAAAASVYFSPNVALLITKSIQVFDYIRLINV